MNISEAIIGLGSHAAQELLELSELDESPTNMVGPEFTYLGIYLSALAYKEVNAPNLDAAAASLDSLKSIHVQAGKSDAKLLGAVAALSITAYGDAMPSWPKKGTLPTASITLCDLLAKLLKSSAKVDLNVTQKAKLRARIEDVFEAMKLAHTEMRNAESTPKTPSGGAAKAVQNAPFDETQTNKSALLEQYEEGEITFEEYHRGLSAINEKELKAQLEMARHIYSTSNLWDKKFAIVAAVIFVVGFFAGAWLYPKIFGFSSAEECTLAAKHRYAVAACYELYPSIQKK